MLRLVGESKFNPEGSNNNCVSVTLAKIMLYPDVHVFWHNVLGYPWGSYRGMTYEELEKVIQISGWQFRRRVFRTGHGKTAFQKYCRVQHTFPSVGVGARQAACYWRKDGTGHCVESGVALNFARGRNYTDGIGFHFKCYQHHSDGVDVRKELEEAVEIVIYGLKCPPGTEQYLQWQNRLFWERIQIGKEPRRLETVLAPVLAAFPDLHSPSSIDQELTEIRAHDQEGALMYKEYENTVNLPYKIPQDTKEQECKLFFRGGSFPSSFSA